MILALTLPAGWSRRPAAAPPPLGSEAAELIWPAVEGAAQPSGLLLLSPLLPLPRSLPALIDQALASEPDYRLESRGQILLPRLGPWEAVVLRTSGRSVETGVKSSRIYCALDVGYGAFLLVLIECDPARIDERQQALYQLVRKARLRKPAKRRSAAKQQPVAEPAAAAAVVDSDPPPQKPPVEIYLKETLYRHLID